MHPQQEFTQARKQLGSESNSVVFATRYLPSYAVHSTRLPHNTLKSISAFTLLRDVKINGVAEQMQAVARALAYTKLTFEHSLSENIEFIQQSHCGTNMLWLVCDFLTVLVPLDLPSSKIECTTYLNVWRNHDFHVYLIDSASLNVVPITKTDAFALASKQPVFTVNTNHVFCGKEVLANIEYQSPKIGCNFRHHEIKIKCCRKPSKGTISVLLKMGTHIKKPASFLGVLPTHITVEFNGECLNKIIRPASML